VCLLISIDSPSFSTFQIFEIDFIYRIVGF
jgi:hypothetical protein